MMTSQTYTTVLGQLATTQVRLKGYLYQVDFGPAVQSRYHTVDRQKYCTCGLGACATKLRRCHGRAGCNRIPGRRRC